MSQIQSSTVNSVVRQRQQLQVRPQQSLFPRKRQPSREAELLPDLIAHPQAGLLHMVTLMTVLVVMWMLLMRVQMIQMLLMAMLMIMINHIGICSIKAKKARPRVPRGSNLHLHVPRALIPKDRIMAAIQKIQPRRIGLAGRIENAA